MRFTPIRVLCGFFALSAAPVSRSEEALQTPPHLRPYQPATDTVCYVGTYTAGGRSKGIYFFRLETQNAEVAQNILLVPLGLAAESVNPSFLAADFSRRLVFAANETDTFNGAKTGAVSAFRIDPGTGRLALINQVSSGGAGPCHLALDRTGKFLVVSNYNDGTIAVVPVAADGQLRAPSQVIQHRGRSVNPQRQAGRDEGLVLAQRAEDHIAQLPRLGRFLGNLEIMLGLGGLGPGGDAPVDPVQPVQNAAAVGDLVRRQDVGDAE